MPITSGHKMSTKNNLLSVLNSSYVILTLALLNPDIPCLCKQCRSRSVGFWRSQLIWIYTVCHSECEVISTIWIKKSDWLKIRSRCDILIYSAWQVLKINGYTWYISSFLKRERQFLWLSVCISFHPVPMRKGSTLKGNNCSQVNPFSERGQTTFVERPPLNVYSAPLTWNFWIILRRESNCGIFRIKTFIPSVNLVYCIKRATRNHFEGLAYRNIVT